MTSSATGGEQTAAAAAGACAARRRRRRRPVRARRVDDVGRKCVEGAVYGRRRSCFREGVYGRRRACERVVRSKHSGGGGRGHRGPGSVSTFSAAITISHSGRNVELVHRAHACARGTRRTLHDVRFLPPQPAVYKL